MRKMLLHLHVNQNQFISSYQCNKLTSCYSKIDALKVIRQDSLFNINRSGTIKSALKHWAQSKGVNESCE